LPEIKPASQVVACIGTETKSNDEIEDAAFEDDWPGNLGSNNDGIEVDGIEDDLT
jgi:hypothetical protein